ncbi:hypothetical protein [uncultured Mediterranean phage uvMED]|nr:hypothetical protein [uncultured Mediterranean phage uvMED]
MIGRGIVLNYWSKDMIFGESDCCVYCKRQYLLTNMIGLNSVIAYKVDGVKAGSYDKHNMFKYACIRCFNHIVLESSTDKIDGYKQGLKLKKIGEKYDENMEDGNKHR